MSNPVSLAPGDVMKSVEAEQEAERIKKIVIAEKSDKLEEERNLLQKYVYDSANPSPVIIAAIVIVSLALIYIIYLIFIKPCLTGEWVDIHGNTWDINHNIITGCLDVYDVNQGKKIEGKVSDNFIEIANMTGVWNYGNTIIFIDGPTYERVL